MSITHTIARLTARTIATLSLVSMSHLAFSQPIDHNYAQYNELLNSHVRWLPGKKASQVDYAALAKEEQKLDAVLNKWSALTQSEFDALNTKQQMAFLINAYNGFTLKLILTEYPNLESIKDLGGLFSSPWKKEFFNLLGEKRTLDWIEHEQLRPVYKDPRIHAAVNCASIGCPALLDEAFTADKLDQQLEIGIKRFLSDASRNRVENGKLQISMIFKWFSEDFEQGYKGSQSVQDFLALYATDLSRDNQTQMLIKNKKLPVSYLDYDWKLNGLTP